MSMADKKQHRCYRCAYLMDAGAYVCCGYLEQTGTPRSFPGDGGEQIHWSSTEPCPHYKRKRGRWFSDVPPGPGKREQMAEKKEQKADTRRGIRAKWNYEGAKQMYFDGVAPATIAEAVSVKLPTLLQYINRYNWVAERAAINAERREREK